MQHEGFKTVRLRRFRKAIERHAREEQAGLGGVHRVGRLGDLERHAHPLFVEGLDQSVVAREQARAAGAEQTTDQHRRHPGDPSGGSPIPRGHRDARASAESFAGVTRGRVAAASNSMPSSDRLSRSTIALSCDRGIEGSWVPLEKAFTE